MRREAAGRGAWEAAEGRGRQPWAGPRETGQRFGGNQERCHGTRAEAVLRVEVSDAAGRPAQMRTKICPRVTEAEAGQAPLSGRNGRPAQV